MTQLKTIQIGSRSIEIHSFSGEVMASELWATTEVSGGGSSGVISNGNGYIQRDPLTSKTTTHEQIHVLSPDGEERTLKVENAQLAIRKGHWVSLICAIRSGHKEGLYVAIFNHNTNAMNFINDAADKACMPYIAGLIGVAVLLLAVFGVVVAMVAKSLVVGLFAVAPCAAYFLWVQRRRGAFRDQISALGDELKSRDQRPQPAAISQAV